MIDIHTHILYGVDDGAKNLVEALDLLEEAEKVGFTKIIFTSHYMEDYYNVAKISREKILAEIDNTKTSNIDLYLGNEILLNDNIMENLNNKKIVTLNNSRYVLIELPFNTKPINLMDVVFFMTSNNLVPILAHPERYIYFYKNLEIYEELVRNGVLLQVNFGSFDEQYGRRAKIIAEALLKSNLVHFIATDVHREGLYSKIPEIVNYLEKLVGKEKINQLTTINPGLVIGDKEIEVEEYKNIRMNLLEKIKINK